MAHPVAPASSNSPDGPGLTLSEEERLRDECLEQRREIRSGRVMSAASLLVTVSLSTLFALQFLGIAPGFGALDGRIMLLLAPVLFGALSGISLGIGKSRVAKKHLRIVEVELRELGGR